MLTRYHDELKYWNERVNMISRKDVDRLWEKHILHSLMLLKYFTFKQKARVLDVGTGGGLPGIPLKIARQDLKLTLVDSIAKKIKMVSMFAQHTGLKDIDAVCMRAEAMSELPKYRRSFDVVVSRAVGKLTDIILHTQSLLNDQGAWVFLKGGDLTIEIQELEMAFPRIEVEVINIEAVGIPSFKLDEKKVITCRFS